MGYMSEKKAKDLFNECMDELYQCSIPSISWFEVMDLYDGMARSEFYLRYCIDEADYDSIVSRYRKLLTKLYRRSFSWFLLDFAPTFCKDGV